MFALIKIVEALILPPGLFVLLLIALAVALHRIGSRSARRPAAFALIVAALLWALSTQPVANLLLDPLENAYPEPSPAQLRGDAIVMLGGGVNLDAPDFDGRGNLLGDSANRLLTTARLYRALHVPVIVSGGPLYAVATNGPATGVTLAEADIAKRQLIQLGVPESQIHTDRQSRNTQENAAFTKSILAAHRWTHPILVTSAFHMRRAVLDFRREGVDVLPYPTDYLARHTTGIYDAPLLPSAAALSQSAIALKEYLGLIATGIGVKG
ncbi:YdcF family protein [Alicyclobacillus sp.]|uniref:YdcF family protein n=1 Tax=Alicyclobacillus sp. TaxID=61169 RepID=UPI0025BBD800|nr:YdcF family protein [Alicyclobacillus sp.]MCL6517017.1 YdcF family protein [Alicyclobacillus sp.]